MILFSLVGDFDDWNGPQWTTRLAVTSAFALGFAVLSLFRHRLPRLVLIMAALGVFGYYYAGLPGIGMVPALMVFIFSAAVVGYQVFAGVLAVGLFLLISALRILDGQDPRIVLGYELLADLALSALAVALAEFSILHRRLAMTQHKMQENYRKFTDFAAKATARTEADYKRLEERNRAALRAQDELAHYLALAKLHGNAALEAVPESHPAAVSLEHVRESTSKALTALRRSVESFEVGDGTRSAGTLGNIIELASSLRDSGIKVDVSAPGVGLDDGLPFLLLRIVREAATNAVIHADTKDLAIFLRPQPPKDGRSLWHVSVRNDGVRAGAKDAVGGYSLSHLRQVVMDAGGTLEWGRLGGHFLLSAEIVQPEPRTG